MQARSHQDRLFCAVGLEWALQQVSHDQIPALFPKTLGNRVSSVPPGSSQSWRQLGRKSQWNRLSKACGTDLWLLTVSSLAIGWLTRRGAEAVCLYSTANKTPFLQGTHGWRRLLLLFGPNFVCFKDSVGALLMLAKLDILKSKSTFHQILHLGPQ